MADSKDLVGRTVLVPQRVWPEEKPPKGKTGWEGHVTGTRSGHPGQFYVKFPEDANKYFFEEKDLRKWLLPAEAAPKSTGPKSAGKKRAAERPPSPQQRPPSPQQRPPSPQKSPAKKEVAAAPAGPVGLQGGLPPRAGAASPTKRTKEAITTEFDAIWARLSNAQREQLLEQARRMAAQ